jgi:antitoxin component YwqK of YwqJK toxin-antitoxin module
MKYNVIIFVLIGLFTSCKLEENNSDTSRGCNCDNLTLDHLYNHFYIENRKYPYTGMCFKLNKKGDTLETINYNKGKVEGVLTTFYKSGKKKSETTFKKNKYQGDVKEWDENEVLIFHGTYDDGEYDSTLIDNRQ